MHRNHPTAICLFLLIVIVGDAVAAPATPGPRATDADPQIEVVELEGDSGGFVALFRPNQRPDRRGAVLLLHGPGGNADDFRVIRPLRLGLAEAGWDTLSLALPTLYPHEDTHAWLARSDRITARIRAGMTWLKARGANTLVIIAEAESGVIALQFGSAEPPPELRALVLVSLPAGSDTDDATMAALRRLALPVLDVYAEHDWPQVTETAPARRAAATGSGRQWFRQQTVPGARPGFASLEAGLVADIRAWLAAQSGTGGP